MRNKFDSPSFMVEIMLYDESKYYSFQKLNWMVHFHQVNLKDVDLVCLIDMTEIQWVVDFYYILERTVERNF